MLRRRVGAVLTVGLLLSSVAFAACGESDSAKSEAKLACAGISSSSLASKSPSTAPAETSASFTAMAQDVANRGEHAAKAAAEDDRYVALSKDFSRVVSLATTAAQELAAAGNRLDGFATEQSADAYNETVKQGRSALDALWAECDIVNAS